MEIDDNKIKVVSDAVTMNNVEYIKLIKNTKGYNYEFKILSLDIKKVEEINNELLAKFGDYN